MNPTSKKSNNDPGSQNIEELKKLINDGDYESMEKNAKQLIKEYPKSIKVLNLLGVSLIAQNKLDSAEKIYLQILEIQPDVSEALNNLGNIFMKKEKNNKAIYYFEKALVYNPKLSQAYFNLAVTYTKIGDSFQNKGDIKSSIKNYEQAIKNNKEHVDAHNNSGVALKKLNRFSEAHLAFKRAIQIKPDYVEAHNNLGNLQIEQGKIKESIGNFKEAIKIKPDYVEAYSNLGIAFHQLGDFDESFACYQKAIKLQPNFTKLYNNLAASLTYQGRIDEAKKNYNEAFKIEPKRTEYVINANLIMPAIPESRADIEIWRKKYIFSIDTLTNYKHSINDPQKTINPPTFSLAYGDSKNLEVMKKISKFFRHALPIINYKFQKNKKTISNNKKIKVGFISEFFTDHTIGKLYKGLIKNINKDKFELVIFHTSNTKPGFIKDEINNYPDKVINLFGSISDQQKQIENEFLDIIFYPDIGMSASTYFLAYARLAPIQIMSWGHPETSGIDTIDYFLSSSLIETPDSQSFYSEKLVCIDRMPMCFIPPDEPKEELKHADFGLSESKNLYCCPQTLFKIHPDFDLALAAIVKKDPKCLIIMIETKHKSHVEKLRKRWKKNFSSLNDNVLFVKNMPLKRFLSLIKISNVLLDPFHFGSGLSFSESLVVGTPTITMPGKFMRSRVAAGGYKQMKILNAPIAKSVDEYVKIATELANDTKKNLLLRENLKEGAKLHLFNDLVAVKRFETIFEEAHRSKGYN